MSMSRDVFATNLVVGLLEIYSRQERKGAKIAKLLFESAMFYLKLSLLRRYFCIILNFLCVREPKVRCFFATLCGNLRARLLRVDARRQLVQN